MLIEPERSQVLPGFIEYQDKGRCGVGQDGEKVAMGTTGESQAQITNAVHIPSTSNLTKICTAPDDHLAIDLSSNYHHSDGVRAARPLGLKLLTFTCCHLLQSQPT